MTRNDHNHGYYQDLLGAAALGALPLEEQRELAAHAARCDSCRKELAALQATAEVLALAVEDRELPLGLRARIRAAAQREVVESTLGKDRGRVSGYDVIVVGARCAGSPTAMLLARKGYRVLLLDKATFPSDTISTHLIQSPGIARLKQWGLLEQIIATDCPPIGTMTFALGPIALTGSAPPANGVAADYAPRRTVLDKILVDAAIAAGAEFREGFSVRELITEGERVVGIRGHTRDGTIVPEYAPLVVGADGRHSLVARTVHAPRYHVKPVLTCCYYSYWSGVPIEGVEFSLHDSRMVIGFPTNEDLVCILVDWPHQAFPEFRTDVVGNYLKTVERTPELAQRARQGKREERVVGAADLPNFFRKPYGPGWALVGDAGYHKDPVTAQGISDAFRDAELLAEAIDAGLSGREPLDDALANYEAHRNEAALPMYELTSQLARLQTSFEMEQLFHALQRNQDETNRFFGTIVGTVSIPQFFSASNLQRIIAG